jgi:hypothetical protein
MSAAWHLENWQYGAGETAQPGVQQRATTQKALCQSHFPNWQNDRHAIAGRHGRQRDHSPSCPAPWFAESGRRRRPNIPGHHPEKHSVPDDQRVEQDRPEVGEDYQEKQVCQDRVRPPQDRV